MADFKVRVFAGPKHERGVPCGTLVFESAHLSESSAYIEIEAARSRMKKGAVSKVELIDLRPGGGLTNLNVDLHTDTPWSWKRK